MPCLLAMGERERRCMGGEGEGDVGGIMLGREGGPGAALGVEVEGVT